MEPGEKVHALEARGVRVYFEGVRAVDGVDLTLGPGEIVGLIGPNGAGKTTLLNAISLFLPVTEGQIFAFGIDVTAWRRQRLARCGVVRTFQGVATFPRLSVLENVELGALGAGLGRRRARARAWELLTNAGLKDLAPLPASAIPHGHERRVGILRALALSPRFLLLDEPATGLNEAESEELARTVITIRDHLGCGVLVVEHDMRVIFGVCERIQVLDYGKTIAIGSPTAVAANPMVKTAYLGKRGEDLAGHRES